MTKAELVTQVALKTELTKQQTAEVVDLLLECIIKALQAGDKVELRGFGSFRRRDRGPRQVRSSRSPPKPFPFLRPARCFRLG
jgi:integration host factor subunit beta